jgi:hypothetical protein
VKYGFSILFLISFIVSAEWNIEVIDSVGSGCSCTSIAIDSNGYPHVSYYDPSDNELRYASYDGSDWSIEVVAFGLSGECCNSLALDSNDFPFISYWDGYNHLLKVSYWNGSSWEMEPLLFVDIIQWNSISLASGGRVNIASMNIGGGGLANLAYTYDAGRDWMTDWTSFGGYGSVSLKLDSEDRAHIAFYNWPVSGPAISYIRDNGSSWDLYEVDDSDFHNTESISLELDQLDDPHIAYSLKDYYTHPTYLGYASLEEDYEWTVEIVDDAIYGSGPVCLDLDSFENPHIVYRDTTTCVGSALTYVHFSQGIWNPAEIIDDTGSAGDAVSFMLDADDAPHVAYQDQDNMVIRYATRPVTGIETEPSFLQPIVLSEPIPNPFSASTNVRFYVPSDGHAKLELFDLSGRLMETLVDGNVNSGEHSVVLDSQGLSAGVYIIRFECGSQSVSTRLVLLK